MNTIHFRLLSKCLLSSILFFQICTILKLHAQNPEWINYTNSETIKSMCFWNHYIWINAEYSVIRFDTITSEKKIFNHANIPIHNYGMNDIGCDSTGNVWFIANQTRIVKLDSNFGYSSIDTSNWGYNYFVKNLAVSKSGNVCFAAYHAGNYCLFIYDGTQFTRFDTLDNGDAISWINNISFDKQSNLFALGNQGLIKYNGTGWQYATAPFVSTFSYDKIRFDPNNDLFISTSGRILKLNGLIWDTISKNNFPLNQIFDFDFDNNQNLFLVNGSYKLIKYDNLTWTLVANIFDYSPEWSIRCNTNNQVWIGGSRFFKYDGTSFTVFPHLVSSFHGNIVSSIGISPINNFKMFGFQNDYMSRYGLSIFDNSEWWLNLHYQYWPPTGNNQWIPGDVQTIAGTDSNNIYVGSDYGLLHYENAAWSIIIPPPNVQPWQLFLNHANELVATGTPGLSIYDGNNWTIYDSANTGISNLETSYCFVEDSSHNYWIGTNVGLLKFDGNSWSKFDTSNSAIFSNKINSISTDNASNIYLISEIDTVFYYNPPNPTIASASSRLQKFNGITFSSIDSTYLFTNGVSTGLKPFKLVQCDKIGNVYYTSPKTFLRKYNPAAGITQMTFDSSGLPDNEVFQMKVDKYDNLWLATYSGVGVYRPNGVSLNNILQNDFSRKSIIYPNPASDFISFILPIEFTSKKNQLSIYDINGRLILMDIFLSNEFVIPLQSFKGGIYFYKILGEGQNYLSGKFIKT